MHHTSELDKLLLSSNVRISDKISRLFQQKLFPYMQKTKQRTKSTIIKNSINEKVQKGEIFMVFSLMQCNICITELYNHLLV